MFSAITRMRPACARRPDAAIAIDLRKSTAALLAGLNLRTVSDQPSALADRGLEEAEAALIERGRGLIVHLVGGDLDHLVFEVDRVAGGP